MPKKVLLTISLLILAACAQTGPPPGGPVDTTPPEVIMTNPGPGSVNVPPDQAVEIEFSETIKPATVTDAVFITPYPEEDVKLKMKGRRLIIEFAGPLPRERTCVVTLGTAIRDLRNNPLSKSFTLAFSTGAYLDKGVITGRVYGEQDASGINVWAYLPDGEGQPDPAVTSPDYTVQCSKDGRFTFTHLAEGTYRLFAVEDRAADRLYQPVEDRYGCASQDVSLAAETGNREEQVHFRLTRADTAAPEPVRAQALNNRTVILMLSEPLPETCLPSPDSLRLSAADSRSTVSIENVYRNPMDRRMLFLRSSAPLTEGPYKISAAGLCDDAGNRADTAGSALTFQGTAAGDTLPPAVVHIEPPAARGAISLQSSIRLIFSEPVVSADSAEAIILEDTSGAVIPGEFSRPHPTEAVFAPAAPLPGKAMIRGRIRGGAFRDFAGHRAPDSVVNWKTVNPDTFSSVSGRVTDADSLADGPVYLTARQLAKDGSEYRIMLREPGRYEITGMLPGLYVLTAFRDEDANSRYSHGTMVPFLPAERFTVLPDTLKLRSRWPNEGNDLIIVR